MTIDKIFVGKAVESGMSDGGEGSGNWGHKGRPGQVGGSGKGGGKGNTKAEYSRQRKEYTLSTSRVGASAGDAKRSWGYSGKRTRTLPKGSGRFTISSGDIQREEHSIVRYLDENGNLTPERQRLHDRAIDRLFRDKPKMVPRNGEQPTYYFLGGGSASGKGSLTNPKTCADYDMPSKTEVPVIDADEMKKALPEYETQKRIDDGAAGFSHEESSSLAKRANDAAFTNGYNCVLDGTGDGTADKVRKKIQQARAAGYKVEARYVTAPMEVALERARERGRTSGRKIDEDVIVGIHKSVSKIFPEVASEFDHVVLYDTNQPKGVPGKKIAECWRGKPITVYDQAAYDAFLGKAHYGE